MRIVLDTDILVRAAADEQGLAGRLLQEIISGPHILVISPYILSEIARVLSYPRLQARWQLDEETIMEFVSRVGDFAEIVLTTTPDRVVIADPYDDPTNRWTRSAIITMSARSLAALKRGSGSAKPSAVAQPPGNTFNIGWFIEVARCDWR